jgi:hypothetical protein
VGAMRRIVGAAAVVLGMLALSGCGGGDPLPTLPPTPSTTPVFASEEEALAAAEDAYAAYLEMSNLISSEGGVNPERIEPYAVRTLLESALSGFETLREKNWHTTGTTTIHSSMLQYADLNAVEGESVVAAYICEDYAALDVVDESGTSVVSSERPDLQAFEVFFDLVGGELVGSSLEPWDPGVCDE